MSSIRSASSSTRISTRRGARRDCAGDRAGGPASRRGCPRRGGAPSPAGPCRRRRRWPRRGGRCSGRGRAVLVDLRGQLTRGRQHERAGDAPRGRPAAGAGSAAGTRPSCRSRSPRTRARRGRRMAGRDGAGLHRGGRRVAERGDRAQQVGVQIKGVERHRRFSGEAHQGLGNLPHRHHTPHEAEEPGKRGLPRLGGDPRSGRDRLRRTSVYARNDRRTRRTSAGRATEPWYRGLLAHRTDRPGRRRPDANGRARHLDLPASGSGAPVPGPPPGGRAGLPGDALAHHRPAPTGVGGGAPQAPHLHRPRGRPPQPQDEGFWRVQLFNVYYYAREARKAETLRRFAPDLAEDRLRPPGLLARLDGAGPGYRAALPDPRPVGRAGRHGAARGPLRVRVAPLINGLGHWHGRQTFGNSAYNIRLLSLGDRR